MLKQTPQVSDFVEDVVVTGEVKPELAHILTPKALSFAAALHRQFNPTRIALLQKRVQRQASIDAGMMPDFLPETEHIRSRDWQVASTPPDLLDRRVEITGPVERKMMINALNCGARVFMADFEDSLSPTWANIVQGQANLFDAVRRTITFTNPDGQEYRLNEQTAVLMVRPRGWHLTEKHVLIDGEPISASIFDFALCFFHNAHELISRGTGPYFYLPKLESHLEARLWNDVFIAAQKALGIMPGMIRATVLIETILAAFEMDEILYELREHSAGLNAGRWDYIFSAIKKFSKRSAFVLPDRAQITMNVPFMRAYTELLVKTCHKRGAHAIGGMAAFIPSRRDEQINEMALRKVREDKTRESNDGFDGTWVAHPDLVPVAKEVFDAVLGDQPNQKERLREDVNSTSADLLSLDQTPGEITEAGVRLNINVALQYLNAWLMGVGAAAIHNLMEDAATAEISRAQLWQWHTSGAQPDGKAPLTHDLYCQMRCEETVKLEQTIPQPNRLKDAAHLLDDLVLADHFAEFLTLDAYNYLD
jgi:malate synthase